MRRYRILTAIFLCALTPAGSFAAGKGTILPTAVAGWNATAVNSFTPQNAELVAPSQAPVLREYGLAGIEQADYVRGSEHLRATLYRMRDQTGSYGAFTFLRTPEMPSTGLGDYSGETATRALILRGNLLLGVEGESLGAKAADIAALQSVVTSRTELGPYPTLDLHLPVDGMVKNSQRYMVGPQALQAVLPIASGDWAGFSHGAEAVLARYRFGREEVTLLLVDFPTPQAAATELKNYSRRFTVNPLDAKTSAEAGGQGGVYAIRDLTLVALVSGAHSRKVAGELLRRVGSGEEITWNEPSLNVHRPSDAQILIGIFTGTAILCLYALIAGLAFGGVRLLIKRMVPGRVFDRDTSTEILQLGITSKRMEGSDFFYVGPPR